MRKATEKDIETIINIEMNSGGPYETTKEKLRKYFKRRFKAGEVFFMHKDIGYISIIDNFKDGSQINFLSVKKSFHNQGIGTKLIEKAEKYIKSSNKHKIYLYCWYKNTKALKFYLNLGYEIYSWQEKRYSWGDPAIILYKKI